MDELAAAAAVVAMAIDDDAEEDSELEDSPGAAAVHDAPMPDLGAAEADKENESGLPVAANQRAEARKVLMRP